MPAARILCQTRSSVMHLRPLLPSAKHGTTAVTANIPGGRRLSNMIGNALRGGPANGSATRGSVTLRFRDRQGLSGQLHGSGVSTIFFRHGNRLTWRTGVLTSVMACAMGQCNFVSMSGYAHALPFLYPFEFLFVYLQWRSIRRYFCYPTVRRIEE